jgi:signal recognition particle GTPase
MGPEQYHKYLQYVFDTQFKTPEEKKMKKSMIKKINKSQKKKGLPVFKESVNEAKKENPIAVAKRIIKNKQHEKVDGVLIDTQTANLIVQIYKAVKPVNKKKMEKMPMKTLGHLAWKAVGGK